MMKLIPYTKIDGQRNFRDSEIMSLYDIMESDGVTTTVFYDGNIQNRESFLGYMKSKSCQLHILLDESCPIAIIYLDRFEGRTARIHFCCFLKIWGKKTIEAARFSLNEILNYKYENEDDEYFFDVLIGRVPSTNKSAISFLKKVGCSFVGEIPFGYWNNKKQKSKNCFITYIDREVTNGWK